MDKQIFKVGDTVYCKIFGEGVVWSINNDHKYPICVDFLSDVSSKYTHDGRYCEGAQPCLSFTPWTEKPNLVRPVDYNEWIGKLCAFWDEEIVGVRVGKLIEYRGNVTNRFRLEGGFTFSHCKLLDDQDFVNKLKNK